MNKQFIPAEPPRRIPSTLERDMAANRLRRLEALARTDRDIAWLLAEWKRLVLGQRQ